MTTIQTNHNFTCLYLSTLTTKLIRANCFFDVLFAVAVVVAKALFCLSEGGEWTQASVILLS